MPEPIYTARSTVVKVDGIHRRATLEDGTTVDFGVHGPIKRHFGLETEPDLPLPVDFPSGRHCWLTTGYTQRRTGGARDRGRE